MQRRRRSSRNGIRLTRPLLSISILVGALILAISLAPACRQKSVVRPVPDKEPIPSVAASGTESAEDAGELCGECLELPDARVCTEQGELRNSCMAICLGELIVCKGACPCPGEDANP